MEYANINSGYPLQTAAPKTMPNLSDAVSDLAPVVNRMEEYLSRLLHCNDRLTGSRPQGVEKSADSPPAPNHVLYAIQSHRSRLGRMADFLEAEIQRLESSIGG